MNHKKRILFVCTQNSARSQMAEGLMRSLYGDSYEVFSAGTEPYRVNPFAIQAMDRAKIDIHAHRSKSIDEFDGKEMDYVVTVCDNAKENCPYFPGGKILLHQSFSDPAAVSGSDEEVLAEFERVRDEIRKWIEESVQTHGDGAVLSHLFLDIIFLKGQEYLSYLDIFHQFSNLSAH